MKRMGMLTMSLVLGLGGSAALAQADAGHNPAAGVARPVQPVPNAAGVYPMGPDVKPPIPTSMPDPEFSKLGRKKKINGNVLIGLVVDAEGNPQNVHVVRSLADQMGNKDQKAARSMDEKAMEAVKQYRFKPAMREGVPVPVEMKIEVNFQIF